MNNKRNDQHSGLARGFSVAKGTEQSEFKNSAHREIHATNTKSKDQLPSSKYSQISLNNESQREEEERRHRETAEKERFLLERIKFLARKRQHLYEKKQRELMLNNTRQENEMYANRNGEENNQVDEHVQRKCTKNEEQNSESFNSADS